jgi:hypothetical protein
VCGGAIGIGSAPADITCIDCVGIIGLFLVATNRGANRHQDYFSFSNSDRGDWARRELRNAVTLFRQWYNGLIAFEEFDEASKELETDGTD